jgi:hypothetical protein
MSLTILSSTTPSAFRLRPNRLVIPGLALLAFGAFALLWIGPWHAAYFDVQLFVGTSPYLFPFLDTHALLSAAECQRQGIDVYLQNPCDALGRVHAYSPSWLRLIPGFLGTGDTMAVGLGLDLVFILSLGTVFRPRSWGAVAVFALAVLSPITLFALERANCDLIIFLLLTLAALRWTGSERARLLCYAICLLAGALKYFPMVALSLVLRERWRRGFAVAAAAGVAIVLLVVGYRSELQAAFGNIPANTDYFSDVFSARNLPLGILELTGLNGTPLARIVAGTVFLLLGVGVLTQGWRFGRQLAAARIDWTEWEMRIVVIASLVLPACFFTAQNVAYRCVYLLLAMPGLVRLRQSAGDSGLRRRFGGMIAVCLFMLWECAISFNIGKLAELSPQVSASAFYSLLQLGYWLGRELLWWWLVAGFAGIASSFALAQPLTADVIGGLRRLIPVPARR